MSRGDDDYDRRPKQLSGLDSMFANTNIVLLILFSFCCQPIPLILGAVGLAVCKDPLAKRNATIVTVMSAVLLVLGIAANFMGFLALQGLQK